MMLAKEAWRLAHDSTSLLAQVLKSHYYPRGSFLDAKIGCNQSYTWWSITASQEVLSKGTDLGIIIYDQLGKVIASKSIHIEECFLVEIAEALAYREGVALAQIFKLSSVVLEGDCQIVMSALKRIEIAFFYLGRVI
ncbi:conserved hypothetical protein [Ricinus communis]|uniref:RNase H type-1 domain-containing protein n=1 Tax=Ricinus communis TaxID=3988 RepID=B9SUK9_RICCO|nr:conserved hypothetical protein [Ricinus communis]